MANQKITELGEKTAIEQDDLIVVVEDPAGSPVTKKLGLTKLASGLWSAPSSDVTLSASSSAQAAFGAAQDTLTVESSTTYFFEALYYMTTGTTTHTKSTLFAGTATFTACHYMSAAWNGVDLAINTTPSFKMNNVATEMVVIATSTAASAEIWLRGVMRINAGGTLIPQIKFSANPTGTNLMKTGSFFQMFPAGSSSAQSVGPWA